jgi:hypothetical protein
MDVFTRGMFLSRSLSNTDINRITELFTQIEDDEEDRKYVIHTDRVF